MLVFRGVSAEELQALASGTVLTGPAFAATPSFLDAFGLDAPDDEDAERTLCCIAGLWALLTHGRRLVVVADVPARDGGTQFGAVGVDRIAWDAVTAIFAEDPESQGLADAAASAMAQLGVEAAWDHPSHTVLLADADLLWFGPQEWAALVG